jgi:nicotinamide-nucleotide amidase
MITSIPGSSAYFQGSIVAYANTVKENLLQVSSETLEQHGAVSEETVTEMVAGAIKLLGVDIAIATSGIAGPGGGSPEKPVGTIWMAVGDEKRTMTRKLQLTKNRLKNIEYTSIAALNMLRKFLLGK